MKLNLNKRQSDWLATVTANGMTIAQAAVDWASESYWSTKNNGNLIATADCLQTDLEEGDTNGAGKKAAMYIAVLNKLTAPERLAQQAAQASVEAAEVAASQKWYAEIEAIWGTRNAEKTPQIPNGVTVKSKWFAWRKDTILRAMDAQQQEWMLESPKSEWKLVCEVSTDYDFGSGYGRHGIE